MTLCTEWTTEREQELKKLHEEGFSASQIAFKLGGTTRNAIIGKRARMGLPQVNKPHVHNVPRAPRKPKEPGAPKNKGHHHAVFRIVAANGNSSALRISRTVASDMPPLRCVEIEPRNLTLAELDMDNECHWIPKDDGLYCGRPIKPGYPYCPAHTSIAYKPMTETPRPHWRREGTDFARRSA